MCIAGYDGYFKKINSAVSKTLGYSMDELYSRPINDFVHEDDKNITAKVRHELTRSKPLLNFENRYVRNDGEIVWLSWTSLPVEQEQVIFAIAKNITHKKKLEADRNALLASLTRINEQLKRLNYTATHDLRSPVNNLLTGFELIDVSRIQDPDTLEVIKVLQLAGEKLKETLNNYVDLLTTKNAGHPEIEELSFQKTLDHVSGSLSSLIQNSKVRIKSDFTRAPTVKFNRGYLESVFLNLITNSIKYARPESTPEVSIFSEKGNGVTRLIFSDNGLGFDFEKVKDEIFGLHQKFHNHTESKGIGLYLVHSHVTSMGGKIAVESKPNHGTTFTITLKD